MAVTTGETLFRFVSHPRLRRPLITTSLEVTHGQDNGGDNSFVAIVESQKLSLRLKKQLYVIVCV